MKYGLFASSRGGRSLWSRAENRLLVEMEGRLAFDGAGGRTESMVVGAGISESVVCGILGLVRSDRLAIEGDLGVRVSLIPY